MITIPAYLMIFLQFFVIYLFLKSYFFYKKFHINPFSFVKSRNIVEFISWILLMVILVFYGLIIVITFIAGEIGQPFTILNNPIINFTGVAFTIIGLVIMILAHYHMGQNWRMGIDKQTTITLIQSGLFSVSRNPVYIGILLQALGLFLLIKTSISLLLLILLLVVFFVIIQTEEKFLADKFGQQYDTYKKKVRRFF